MIKLRTLVAAVGLATLLAVPAVAAEAPKPPAQKWSFEGLFGTYDRGALQRGFQIYKEVCSSCHAMNQLRYRDLGGGTGGAHGGPVVGLGFNEDEVRQNLAEWRYLGQIPETKEWKAANNRGELVVIHNYQELNSAFGNILSQVTGEQLQEQGGSSLGGGKSGGLLGLFKRKK
jgi:hypothetical protein